MTTDTSATRNGTGMAAGPKSGPTIEDPRRFNVKGWLLWTAAFVSFPIAGIAAQAAVGRINDVVAALVGGWLRARSSALASGWSPAACSVTRWSGSLPRRLPWASACSPVPGWPAMAPASVSWL